tara:strand:- start:583 stop:1098 length:516 start_codon:yes stop_codon:yes gene_type:complete
MAYPPNDNDLTDAKTTIVNILKIEGYKIDSGSLFLAFKDAGGEMSQFAPSLEELQEENIIKSDSEGNIMTVEDYQRDKSQNNEDESNNESEEYKKENNEIIEDEKIKDNEISNNDEMQNILEKKKEADAWIIEKAKNGSKTNEKLSLEIAELRNRVEKLESILEKINEALK